MSEVVHKMMTHTVALYYMSPKSSTLSLTRTSTAGCKTALHTLLHTMALYMCIEDKLNSLARRHQHQLLDRQGSTQPHTTTHTVALYISV